jgi:hypothetical protein
MPLKPPRVNTINSLVYISIGILILILGLLIIGFFTGFQWNFTGKEIQEGFEWDKHNSLLTQIGRNLIDHQSPYLGIQQVSTLENASNSGAKLPQSIGGGGEIPMGLWYHPVPKWDAPYELKQLHSPESWKTQYESWNQPVIEAKIALQKQAEV